MAALKPILRRGVICCALSPAFCPLPLYAQATTAQAPEQENTTTESAEDPLVDPPGQSIEIEPGRSGENAVSSAQDAFGTRIGREALGLYGPGSVRGFSPTAAGNIRIEGMFFDQQAGLTGRIQSGSQILIGPSAQIDPFPAPTGIVDFSLRTSEVSGTSVLASVGPYGSYGAEFDSRIRFGDGPFSVSAGAGAYRDRFANGGSGDALAAGMVAALDLSKDFSVKGFWGRTNIYDETAPPIYITRDAAPPARIERGSYDGPFWAQRNSLSDNLGVVGKLSSGPWRVDFGAFRSLSSPRSSFANIVDDIADDNTGQRIVFANPPSRFASTSGEMRVSRLFPDGRRRHQLLVSLRGRSIESRFGGSDLVDLGRAVVGEEVSPPEPAFLFGDQTFDEVRQLTGGISYGLDWPDLLQLRVGIQVVDYQKEITGPTFGDLERNSIDYLPNVTGSLTISSEVLLYGSYTRGLEENGQAPDFAANRLNILPALVTSQVDVGARWEPNEETSLILGYFRVQKPYFNLDPANVFRQLGNQIHEGLEFSLKSNPFPSLTVVAGAVVQDPRVSTETVIEGVGPRPVAQSNVIGQVNFDYVLPKLAGISIDGTLNFTGSRPADVANSVDLDSFWNLSLGARYRFKLGSLPATLRISVQNVTNNFEWLAIGSGVYEPLNQRALQAYIAVDF